LLMLESYTDPNYSSWLLGSFNENK
jgi:hypothetical protein